MGGQRSPPCGDASVPLVMFLGGIDGEITIIDNSFVNRFRSEPGL
jgi:hypothetical protein